MSVCQRSKHTQNHKNTLKTRSSILHPTLRISDRAEQERLPQLESSQSNCIKHYESMEHCRWLDAFHGDKIKLYDFVKHAVEGVYHILFHTIPHVILSRSCTVVLVTHFMCHVTHSRDLPLLIHIHNLIATAARSVVVYGRNNSRYKYRILIL